MMSVSVSQRFPNIKPVNQAHRAQVDDGKPSSNSTQPPVPFPPDLAHHAHALPGRARGRGARRRALTLRRAGAGSCSGGARAWLNQGGYA